MRRDVKCHSIWPGHGEQTARFEMNYGPIGFAGLSGTKRDRRQKQVVYTGPDAIVPSSQSRLYERSGSYMSEKPPLRPHRPRVDPRLGRVVFELGTES